MESLANRSRPVPSRMQRTYRVEMGGRTVLISLGLALLTGLVVFYMGVLAGKGSRSAAPPESAESSAQLPPAAQPGTPGNLAFSENLLQNKPVVEDLWKTQQQASQDTAHLLSRAQRELTVEEVPATPAAKQPAPAEPQTSATAPVQSIPRGSGSAVTQPAPRSSAPAATKGQPAANAAARDSELYTVQVFSSKSRESAVGLVDRLKGMGFAAYLNQFQDSGRNTWYRVRVGKTNKTEAERLKSSLQERANLKSPQVLPL